MNRIKTIAIPKKRAVTGCGECRSTCQSACKTSCTVGNQSCERNTKESKIEEIK
jgi:predicted ribosomally synthesized six-cysteine peptide SCIFF